MKYFVAILISVTAAILIFLSGCKTGAKQARENLRVGSHERRCVANVDYYRAFVSCGNCRSSYACVHVPMGTKIKDVGELPCSVCGCGVNPNDPTPESLEVHKMFQSPRPEIPDIGPAPDK